MHIYRAFASPLRTHLVFLSPTVVSLTLSWSRQVRCTVMVSGSADPDTTLWRTEQEGRLLIMNVNHIGSPAIR